MTVGFTKALRRYNIFHHNLQSKAAERFLFDGMILAQNRKESGKEKRKEMVKIKRPDRLA